MLFSLFIILILIKFTLVNVFEYIGLITGLNLIFLNQLIKGLISNFLAKSYGLNPFEFWNGDGDGLLNLERLSWFPKVSDKGAGFPLLIIINK